MNPPQVPRESRVVRTCAASTRQRSAFAELLLANLTRANVSQILVTVNSRPMPIGKFNLNRVMPHRFRVPRLHLWLKHRQHTGAAAAAGAAATPPLSASRARSSLQFAHGHFSRRYAKSKWLLCPSAQATSTPVPEVTCTFRLVGFFRRSLSVVICTQ